VPGQQRIAPLNIVLVAVFLGLAVQVASSSPQYSDRDHSGAPPTSANAPPPEARIDINHAGLNQLLKIPGMTQTWAVRILRFRPYRTKDYIIAHREEQ
jgi:DNA uptake protein ComE-like DNA-binding protein